jgi:cyclophilin family peptidyl-prolyl cis-trans isomerase
MHTSSPRPWPTGLFALSIATLVSAASTSPRIQAQPAAVASDPAAVKAEFDSANKAMKEVVGELAVLEAKYHQPGANKAALEGRFRELAGKGHAAGQRLERAAFALVEVDPQHKEAASTCGAIAAAALQSDDPARAFDVVERLAAIGAADGQVALIGASAALVMNRPDKADAWLDRAEATGGSPERIVDLRRMLERDRVKMEAEMAAREADSAADDLPQVKIATSEGDVVVELFENEAPNTVANFVSLVDKGYYDGTPFHRVIGGFMAQGGDPTGTGTGGPGYTIECECAKPEARKHFLGSLSMAHAGRNTGGSQFFLTFRPTEHLDGRHTVFGRVIEGFDVLPRLVRTQDGEGRTMPGVEPSTIVKAEVVRRRDHPYQPVTLPDPRGR